MMQYRETPDLNTDGAILVMKNLCKTHDESIAAKAQRVIRLFDGRIATEVFNGQ